MLSLTAIEQQYPEHLRPYKRALLREYLQYKILEIIFTSVFARKLSFLGGTALRIVYDNTRFSEDLDFDNFSLNEDEFAQLAEIVRAGLDAQGMRTEITLAGKEAYRCNVRFPGILHDNDLSPIEGEKVLVQIDSLAHGFSYEPDRKILNKFDVFTEIFATPIDILLSQKINAAISRRRPKGRDFFDIVFLLSRTLPNYIYLEAKLGIADAEALRARLLAATAEFDFEALARDVRPFLFNPSDAQRVEKFRDVIAQAKW
ncbi:nucleotidyl transferase AbiEii/AbiGii toxin family protein [Candidatus Kaiserbacteria bacterium]|nr:nucleotidyl transferase AbiEii/AbiGii toxin family protein [Candidatus Kaiserbacteria bacterium]